MCAFCMYVISVFIILMSQSGFLIIIWHRSYDITPDTIATTINMYNFAILCNSKQPLKGSNIITRDLTKLCIILILYTSLWSCWYDVLHIISWHSIWQAERDSQCGINKSARKTGEEVGGGEEGRGGGKREGEERRGGGRGR